MKNIEGYLPCHDSTHRKENSKAIICTPIMAKNRPNGLSAYIKTAFDSIKKLGSVKLIRSKTLSIPPSSGW